MRIHASTLTAWGVTFFIAPPLVVGFAVHADGRFPSWFAWLAWLGAAVGLASVIITLVEEQWTTLSEMVLFRSSASLSSSGCSSSHGGCAAAAHSCPMPHPHSHRQVAFPGGIRTSPPTASLSINWLSCEQCEPERTIRHAIAHDDVVVEVDRGSSSRASCHRATHPLC